MPQRDGLQSRERPEGPRQRLASGHRRVVDEDGNDERTAAQRGLDLDAQDVLLARVEHPPPPALVGDRHPALPDHGEHDIALRQALSDLALPLDPQPEVLRVEEDVVGAEVGLERVGEPPRGRLGVRPAIADEHPEPLLGFSRFLRMLYGCCHVRRPP